MTTGSVLLSLVDLAARQVGPQGLRTGAADFRTNGNHTKIPRTVSRNLEIPD